MDFESLKNYIKTMNMSHIYQPVMIKKLLESNNCATVEDIAREFVDMDASLLEYYKDRVMVWPKKTLKKHNIVDYDKGTFTLLLDDITEVQRSLLIELCNSKTDEYVDRFEDRMGIKNNQSPVSGVLRYDIIAKSKGICTACGVSSQVRPLDVDHIVPVNMGGTNEPSNLQVLCYQCNRQKRDRDKTNFVQWRKRLKDRHAGCILCKTRPVASNTMASAIRTKSPESDLHSVVFPRRHVGIFSDLIPAEKSLCFELVESVKENITEKDGTVDGFTVSFDSGLVSHRHMHCHINVIPRRKNV